MSHEEDQKCPILIRMLGGVCVSDIVDSLGFKAQRQESYDRKYSYLIHQDIEGVSELEAYKIPLDDVPNWMSDIITDPSKATLKDVRILCRLTKWQGEAHSGY